jgi:radical SAM protein with 4Fe4S-binding SPASM domain
MNKNIYYPVKIMLPALTNRLLGRRSPVKVGLQVTDQCNLDCALCYFRDPSQQRGAPLSTPEICAVIDDLKKLNISILALTGGEPLLRADLTEIIRCAAGRGILTGVATNGTLLSDAIVKEHKEAGLEWYHLSVDGSSKQIQERFRGPDAFDAVDSAIDIINQQDMGVIATTVVTKENRTDMENIARYLWEKGVRIWSPTLALPCGNGKVYLRDNLFSRHEVREIYDSIYELSRRYKRRMSIYPMDPQVYYPYLMSRDKPMFMRKIMYGFMGGCSVVKGGTIHVNCDGTVKPCAYFPGTVPDANVRRQSIIHIFRNHPYLVGLRDKSLLKGKCNGCQYLFCCGGCRSRGAALFDDPFAEDVYCVIKDS